MYLKKVLLCLLLMITLNKVSSSDDGVCSMDPTNGCDSNENKIGADELEEQRAYSKMTFTNDLDWKLRKNLDYADEFITTDPEHAMKLFQEILGDHPDSPRAFYANIRAKQFVNTSSLSEDQQEKRSSDIIDEFLSLVKRNKEHILDPLYHSAVAQALTESFNANLTEKKQEILEYALENRSIKNERYHELLIMEYYISGQYETGVEFIEKCIDQFHLNKFFKFMQGLLLKKANRKKEANKLLRNMELSQLDTYYIGSDVLGMIAELRKRGKPDEVAPILKESSKLHVFPSMDQLPLDFSEDLESKPVWSIENDVGLTSHDEEFSELMENWSVIKEECLELLKNESEWLITKAPEGFVSNGRLLEYPLFSWGRSRKHYCSQAPKTCSMLKKFKQASSFVKGCIKFTVLEGQSSLYPYAGPTNFRLRAILPLKIYSSTALRVGKSWFKSANDDNDDTNYPIKEGEIFVYDDSFEHEEANTEDGKRIFLSIDLPHPDLTYEQSKQSFNQNARYTYSMY